MKFVFRRTGDTSEELRLQYRREFVNGEYDSDAHNYFFLNAQFPAGQSEITKIYGFSANFDDDQVVGVFFPFKVTAQIFGDGQLYGVHRIWKAGIPNTASTVYYDDDRTRSFELRAAYPNSGQVGQTINIDFNVLNTGSEATGNTITISSVQRAQRRRPQTQTAGTQGGLQHQWAPCSGRNRDLPGYVHTDRSGPRRFANGAGLNRQ